LRQHPVFIPRPIPGVCAICWLLAEDGHCYAREFYEDTKECQKAFAAQAMQFAIKGRIGKMPENGHPLHGEFEDLFVWKPSDFRFIGFRHTHSYYVTNGAPKRLPERKQDADYRIGLALKEEFFLDLKIA
jgi:hypothetical protein